MPLSSLQRKVLAALAKNRGTGSWVAGSIVIAPWLSRIPQDIDIHHLSEASLQEAVAADQSTLKKMGFLAGPARMSSQEIEISFACDCGTVTVNWVREATPPKGGPVKDSICGTRASYAAVVERKIEMYLQSGASKHALDLREIGLRSKGTSEIPCDLRTRIVQLELMPSRIENDG